MVLNMLHGNYMVSSFNFTHIAFIPKKCNPLIVIGFRPNSLRNVIYKLLSKVITNRLKPLMDSIISISQSVFILGRIITTHELLHSMKNNIRGRIERIMVKLNMSKSYDCVEWSYLKATMKAFGFANK